MESRARVVLIRDGRATLACEQASSLRSGSVAAVRGLAGNGRRTLESRHAR
jgi:hypothetical protein